MNISGKTKLLCVIGNPIEHSLSPLIHNHFAASAELDLAYLAFCVTPETQGDFIAAARSLPIHGFNITMPLKETILPLLDGLDDTATALNAANTVVNRNGKLYGHNTDGDGFVLSLKYSGYAPNRINALILGAGGAARAVAHALVGRGATVTIACRRPNEVLHLDGVEYRSWNDIPALCTSANLLINATPLGMHGTGGQFADLTFLDSLPKVSLVYDLIYSPRETELLSAAKRRGLAAQNGLAHLVCQAALASLHFTGVLPNEQTVRDMLGRI